MDNFLSLHYRELLRRELLARCKRNPKYSSRAFSRDMGVSPGFLSQIIHRRKNLNEDRATRIAAALDWPEDKSNLFITLVRYEHARDAKTKQVIMRSLNGLRSESLPEFFDLDMDAFSAIADWHHYAIVELSKTVDFDPDPRAIARRLGIAQPEVEVAISRLRRLGLLAKDKVRATKANYKSPNNVSSQAIRQFHKTMLDQAKVAIDEQPISTRSCSGITIAIDPTRLEEASNLIAAFRRRLMVHLEQGTPSQVYHLAIQLFRLDK